MWAIRHTSICDTFVDEGASVFFLPHLEPVPATPQMEPAAVPAKTGPVKRMKYGTEEEPGVGMEVVAEGEREEGWVVGAVGPGAGGPMGSALGPDWHTGRTMKGCKEVRGQNFIYSKPYLFNLTCFPSNHEESMLNTSVKWNAFSLPRRLHLGGSGPPIFPHIPPNRIQISPKVTPPRIVVEWPSGQSMFS